jgi:hypothetical protein
MIVAFNYLHFYARRSFTFCPLVVFVIACGISFFIYYSMFEICRLRRFTLSYFVTSSFFCVSRLLCVGFVRVSFCQCFTHQGTMRRDREVCCDSGLSRRATVARPSRGSGLCAGSGGPCSERRLGGRGGQISPCRTGAQHRRFCSPVTGTPAASVSRGLAGSCDVYLKVAWRGKEGNLDEDSYSVRAKSLPCIKRLTVASFVVGRSERCSIRSCK